jgi:hypothetical protein
MRRLAVGWFTASCVVVFACQNASGPGTGPAGPYAQPTPGYGAAPAYAPAPAAPGYGQPSQGYPAPAAGPQQAGYPPPPGYPAPQPGYPQVVTAQGSPVGASTAAPSPTAAGAMAIPGPAAFPCANDSACGLAHCNTQYGKCAFPCADANVDCILGAQCLAGFCVPKPPGS